MKVCDLTPAWSLHGDPVTTGQSGAAGVRFVHSSGRVLNPFEMACEPGSREVFWRLKRRLDMMDYMGHKLDDPAWKWLDVAKLALELSLIRIGKWSDDLKENDVKFEKVAVR